MIQGRPTSTAGVVEVRQRMEFGSPAGDVVSASTLTITFIFDQEGGMFFD